jgi:hypothetical protein
MTRLPAIMDRTSLASGTDARVVPALADVTGDAAGVILSRTGGEHLRQKPWLSGMRTS